MDNEKPVYFGYDLEFLIGGAIIHDDGSITVKFMDPRVVEYIKTYKSDSIKGLVTYHTPGFKIPE